MDTGFQAFMKSIAKGVPSFGRSTGTFMKDMVLYGPSKYDVVVVYENLAIQHIPNAQGRWGNLQVYYPEQTMWSSHPAAILNGDWVTSEQRAAAEKYLDSLTGNETQKAALKFGFRPSDPTVKVLGGGNTNPFNAARSFGIRTEIPPVVEPPSGPVVQNILELWRRQVGR